MVLKYSVRYDCRDEGSAARGTYLRSPCSFCFKPKCSHTVAVDCGISVRNHRFCTFFRLAYASSVYETFDDITMEHTAGQMSHPNLMQNDSMLTINMTSIMPPVVDKAIKGIMVTILFITMVSLGCTMEVSKIKGHILKPKGVVIALVAQYCVMPLTAFGLAKAFQMVEIVAIVVLICGCCPGGNLSNIMALAVQGDINLSIVMTSCSTVLALGLMPLLLFIYCQGFTSLQRTFPYVNITMSLLLILVPTIIGILINYYRPRHAKLVTKVGLIIVSLAAVGVIILSAIVIGRNIMMVMSPPLVGSAALMPFIGYAFGYIISSIFRLSQPECRTVAIETGCQNTQLCSTILKLAFPSDVIGPLFLFPLLYIVFQIIEAMVLMVLLRCHQRFMRKERDVYQPATTDDGLKTSCEGTV
ncbi:hepatic sodium/bile acid cotransporter-like [Dunckerocampus dactyliophorus]|uniref:hepatic sodium/bile acid cotransporter-like n=1 Tax=Dunckerocampus dactyliophorus TaxID=161453 RepID=UPI0024070AE9|nr:hepatic sodium/bile acid cotransporter-like [Dunckerocampus dactyliophorus]